jgi:hypothetical protein
MPLTKKARKRFNCVEFKHKAQERIYQEVKDLGPRAEIDYFDRRAREGPLAPFWRRLEREGRRAEIRGRIK